MKLEESSVMKKEKKISYNNSEIYLPKLEIKNSFDYN